MLVGMYFSAAGAKAQSWRQESIANNIANIDTSGYRKARSMIQMRPDHLSEMGYPAPGSLADPRQVGGGLHIYENHFDLHDQGAMQATGNYKHLSVNGPGFFQVQQGDKTYLTRNGAFTLDENGFLRTSDRKGMLQGAGGPIRIPNADREFTVTKSGVVSQNGQVLGQIQAFLPQNEDSISPIGDSLYSYEGDATPTTASIEQGILEGSNSDPVLEMVELIEASRAFQANIEMIQIQSDSLDTLIQSVPAA